MCVPFRVWQISSFNAPPTAAPGLVWTKLSIRRQIQRILICIFKSHPGRTAVGATYRSPLNLIQLIRRQLIQMKNVGASRNSQCHNMRTMLELAWEGR